MYPIIVYNFKSPLGELLIGSYRDELCLCDWEHRKKRDEIDARIQKELKADYVSGTSSVIEQTILQLEEYFSGKRTVFDIPLLTIGTPFQKNVWDTLLEIPYGKTESYMGLANRMNNSKAIRAISSANGANAISIIIPCHRIIGSDNSLVGYAGGLTAKKKLLELESDMKSQQLDLF